MIKNKKKASLIAAVKPERKVRHDVNTLLTRKILLIIVMHDQNDMIDAKLTSTAAGTFCFKERRVQQSYRDTLWMISNMTP